MLKTNKSKMNEGGNLEDILKSFEVKNIKISDEDKKKVIEFMNKYKLNLEDLEAMILGSKNIVKEAAKIDIPEKKFQYLYFSDTHMGNIEFSEKLYLKMLKAIKKYRPDFVVFVGDLVQGMKGIEGNTFELDKFGLQEQLNYAKNLLSLIEIPIYAIDGEHDKEFYKKKNNQIIVGYELEKELPNYNYLGQLEGHILVNSIKIMLFHPTDTPAYTTSYKIQKLIASIRGGEKPNILHVGHYHQAFKTELRDIVAIMSGTLCGQTLYMKNKKIPAAMGFGIVKVNYENNEIKRLNHVFVPSYRD
ncbi:MAG: metallophosphoesterase family protein [Candidatus Woesearchaeota archaeon]